MDQLSPVQDHMINESGTQCGFCTVGFVVSLSGFCLANNAATYEDALAAIDGNICRCTGYKSIERAAQKITNDLAKKPISNPITWLIENQFIPEYFGQISDRLSNIDVPVAKSSGRVIGGGTDLYVQKHLELIDENASHIVLNNKLKVIRTENNTIGQTLHECRHC